jgi:hypothetical protein
MTHPGKSHKTQISEALGYHPKSNQDDFYMNQDPWWKSHAHEAPFRSAISLLGAFLTVTVPSCIPK